MREEQGGGAENFGRDAGEFLRHHRGMVSQLVVHAGTRAGTEIDIVANDESRSPLTFEDTEGTRVPRLGSVDLIRLAGLLEAHGYTVTEFTVRDQYNSALDSESEEELSDELVGLVRQYGAERAVDFFTHDMKILLVTGVDLLAPSGDSLSIRRNGVTEGPALRVDNEVRHLTSVLNEGPLRAIVA